MSAHYDVVVLGAGPGGYTSARSLSWPMRPARRHCRKR